MSGTGWAILTPAIHRRNNAVTRSLGAAAMAILGWRVEGELPDLPKVVIAFGPHTSNWDFLVCAAGMLALDLRLEFLGKHTLFRGPLRPVLLWMGGIPVDRSSPHGVVGEAIAAFERVDRRILAVAPEGTRRRVSRFKSGFLHIARGAGVPVLYADLDYAVRAIRFGPVFLPGPDVEAERVRAEAHFATIKGRYPR